jgi:hypothetical protein
MFRIVCFVDDKMLAKVKWLLHGHVYNLTDEPVINVRKTSKGDIAARMKAGKRVELFEGWLRRLKFTEVTPADIRSFCEEVGLRPHGYSNVLNDGLRKGWLRRIGDDYRYKVLIKRPKTKPKSRKTKLRVVKSDASKEVA